MVFLKKFSGFWVKSGTIGLFFLFYAGFSCNDDNNDDFPYAYINIYINPTSTEYLELNTPGGWVYLVGQKPSRGILVYRLTMDDFLAYERTCPQDPIEPNARIEVEPSNITVACPVCKSKYIMLDGTPFEGPARRPLRKYQTSYNGSILHIYN